MPLVTLYGKPGCHLCDDARAVVDRVRAQRPFELREVDVSLDPGRYREYGERIPVLALDGEELFEFHVEEAVLLERLEEQLDGPRGTTTPQRAASGFSRFAPRVSRRPRSGSRSGLLPVCRDICKS